jgi:uncharacterized protein YydD (DUF2326 family)
MDRLSAIREVRKGTSELRLEMELLYQRAERDYSDREPQRSRAVEIFAAVTDQLYEEPGRLIIEVNRSGYRFDVQMPREGSEGVERMSIFAFDQTLAQLWGERVDVPSPTLIHDSTLFDGVDERQRAIAIEYGAAAAERHGFQYITLLNTDELPYNDFSGDFDIWEFERLTLTDSEESGSLLGFRF